jgi:hypothetical protein
MATVKKRIRGQPETVQKLRARITEACKVCLNISEFYGFNI